MAYFKYLFPATGLIAGQPTAVGFPQQPILGGNPQDAILGRSQPFIPGDITSTQTY